MSIPRQKSFGPTQKDIGLALNLAQSTVAVALNPKLRSRLPVETVKLIEAKAAELGYRPQKMARVLRNGRSHTIGAIYRMGVYHAPRNHVRNLAQSAFQKGYQLFPLDLEWFSSHREREFSPVEMRAAEDYLLGSAVEGIVFCNLIASRSWDISLAAFCKERGIPCVSLNGLGLSNDVVLADLSEAYHRITLHHIEQGARRIVLQLPFFDPATIGDALHSTGTPYGHSIGERIDGFTRAIEEAGGCLVAGRHPLPFASSPCGKPPRNASLIGEIAYPEIPAGVSDAFELGDRMLSQRLEDGGGLPDSFVCSNDEIAAGVITACIRNGVRVPGDLMVSGADDSPFSRFCGVPLTTVVHASRTLAERSIERLVSLIESPGEPPSPIREKYRCEIIVRQSTSKNFTPA